MLQQYVLSARLGFLMVEKKNVPNVFFHAAYSGPSVHLRLWQRYDVCYFSDQSNSIEFLPVLTCLQSFTTLFPSVLGH